MAWHDAVALEALAEGIPHKLRLAGQSLMLIRQGDAVHAADSICPHKFGLLADGEVGDGCITCPVHDATFDLQTGAPQAGAEWAGRLPLFTTRIQDGVVQIDVPTP